MLPEKFSTSRLRFRKLKPSDKVQLLEFFSDPVAAEFLFLQTTPQVAVENWMNRQIGRYKNKAGGLMAVELAETGEFIGQCGLLYQWVDGIPKWEIGYHFLRRFWGQGYATESAIAFRNLGFENEIAETIISLIHPKNLRSQAVARRNGMTPWKETIWRDHPVVVFRIRREDWERERQKNGESDS